MTSYREFHLRWTIPLVAACAIFWIMCGQPLSTLIPIACLCLVVVAFTFPWDNWAVSRGIWDFPPDRVWFRIAFLPVEEIFFFVIQTVQVGLLTAAIAAWLPGQSAEQGDFSPLSVTLIVVTIAMWLFVGLVSRTWRSSRPHVTYAWHLFFWFGPIILLQWVFGWPILWPQLQVILLATFAIGSILTLSDLWAVRKGIWFFDKRQITGHKVANILPWEEVAFFYVTSVLVSQSTVLLLTSSAR